MTVEEIQSEVSLLPLQQRGELISNLIETLDRSHYDVSDEDLAKRVRETEDGCVQDISFEELKNRVQFRPQQ